MIGHLFRWHIIVCWSSNQLELYDEELICKDRTLIGIQGSWYRNTQKMSAVKSEWQKKNYCLKLLLVHRLRSWYKLNLTIVIWCSPQKFCCWCFKSKKKKKGFIFLKYIYWLYRINYKSYSWLWIRKVKNYQNQRTAAKSLLNGCEAFIKGQ